MELELISKDFKVSLLFLLGDDGNGLRAYVKTYDPWMGSVLRLDQGPSFAYELCEVSDASIEIFPYKAYIFLLGMEAVVVDRVLEVVEKR